MQPTLKYLQWKDHFSPLVSVRAQSIISPLIEPRLDLTGVVPWCNLVVAH